MCKPRDPNRAPTILDILEQNASAKIPASVESPEGKKVVKRFEKAALAYLKSLYAGIPIDAMMAVLKKQGIEEARIEEQAPGEVEKLMAEWVASHANASAEETLAQAMIVAAQTGAAVALNDLLKIEGLGVLTDLPVGLADATLEFARDRAGLLITDIDEVTRKRIAEIIAQGLENQDGIDGIRRSLVEFTDLDEARAELIARTEANRAMSEGAFRANEAIGATEKEWITVGDKDVDDVICIPNEDEGKIPIRDSFQSGDLFTPGHPDCRCSVVYFGVDPEKLEAISGEA